MSHTNPPWEGLVHPEHRPEELETLLRTLRFAYIQLTKFWIEAQSFPIFMRALRNATLREIETACLWIQNGPEWNKLLPDSSLIPELSQPEQRGILLEFARDARRIRTLREEISARLNPGFTDRATGSAVQSKLSEALELVSELALENASLTEIEQSIAELTEARQRTRDVLNFFSALEDESGTPLARNAEEAAQTFAAAKLLAETPKHLFEWRTPQILSESRRPQLEAWQDRATTLLADRAGLAQDYKLTGSPESPSRSPEELRDLAQALKSGGVLGGLKSSFRKAKRRYAELKITESIEKSEKTSAMVEGLQAWADHIEQTVAFAGDPEASRTFEKKWAGIESDFESACQASNWAARVRASFGKELTDFLFNSSESDLHALLENGTSDRAKSIQETLKTPALQDEAGFDSILQDQSERLARLTRISELLLQSGYGAKSPLRGLPEIKALTEEAVGIFERIEGPSPVREFMRKSFAGADTDLSPIEQGLKYVESVQSAGLAPALSAFFLSVQGPSRFAEHQPLVGPALNSLGAVKDHLRRVGAATHGQAAQLFSLPVPELLERLQQALRSPELFESSIQKVRGLTANVTPPASSEPQTQSPSL